MSERKGTKGLELWCKRLVRDCPEVQIDNMTTSWRNGIAFCALVHHFRPDLIDMSTLKPENIYENNQLAFSIAEKHLGIPSLLDPEDMVENDVPDRLSVLTYLSQFYQRLHHTVNTKVSENESKISVSQNTSQTEAPTIIRFGKTGLDKCTACGLPVYLAQRLIVSHKLYHRRCFRCSKCSGHINPKNYDITDGSEIFCDSCKNEKTLSKYLNNNDHDQMGMLAFNDEVGEPKQPILPKLKTRPQSILDKISLFEKNIEKDLNIDNKMTGLSLKDNIQLKRLSNTSDIQNEADLKTPSISKNLESDYSQKNGKEPVYKSNIDKFNFLQTQLTGDGDGLDVVSIPADKDISSNKELIDIKHNKEDCLNDTDKDLNKVEEVKDDKLRNVVSEKESNITDDNRIAKTQNITLNVDVSPLEQLSNNEQEIVISVPPRRKKQQALEKVLPIIEKPQIIIEPETTEYPDHLNPFSDDEDEPGEITKETKKISTNPFGSSDEEDDEVPPIQASPKTQSNETPSRRRIIAVNPFWSDGEEHSSDEEITSNSSKMYKSSITTSTPNLPSSTPRRKKTKAPLPPPVIVVSETPQLEQSSVSMDDIASISSLSSFNSENKSQEKHTPLLNKRRPAPTPTDSMSTMSGCEGSMEHGVDTTGIQSVNSSLGTRRTKGPAPGLPLPERREVKLQMSPEELQVQLDLLETQQLGLERQGVLIEKMIRDKCEGDEASSVPQEEVEDLVIQLCELVNEKNDLFRKQTELMYIRRQQRLEQEQADIEHEIRVLQSRPAVNRIDADKVREEVLVSRLVEIVRMRDELVQQIDAERRRERQEDLAIAASIANKRAQRNNESTSSSMKSVEVVTPKKNKVKDKVKKQFKKVKHSVISKKKDDTTNRKEGKQEGEKKSK